MTALFRVIVSAFVVVATYYFMYWVPFGLVRGIPWGVAAILSYACAMAAGWYTWTRTNTISSSLASSVAYWSLAVGGVAFVAGFFGPMLLAPEANQGPLLGIFITGPLGLVAGAIGGLVHWLIKRKRERSDAAA